MTNGFAFRGPRQRKEGEGEAQKPHQDPQIFLGFISPSFFANHEYQDDFTPPFHYPISQEISHNNPVQHYPSSHLIMSSNDITNRGLDSTSLGLINESFTPPDNLDIPIPFDCPITDVDQHVFTSEIPKVMDTDNHFPLLDPIKPTISTSVAQGLDPSQITPESIATPAPTVTQVPVAQNSIIPEPTMVSVLVTTNPAPFTNSDDDNFRAETYHPYSNNLDTFEHPNLHRMS